MALSTQPYKGARDFYPEDKRLQKWIFAKWRYVVEGFGYEEYDAPILEPTELYASKTSDEIVNEQTYTFTDRANRSVTIRTEMTPSVSRMVAAKRQESTYPLRLYSIPNLWRYERPQRGRLREFWQLNVDLFGVAGLEADFEMIQMADAIMKAFNAKLSQYTIKINSRGLMNSILKDYLQLDGVEAETLIKLIDKMAKMSQAEFTAKLDAIISPDQRDNGTEQKLLDILKVKKIEDLPENVRQMQGVSELSTLLEMASTAGIANVEFDITVARGFDYYTDIVFEVFDTHPDNNRSMFGGGRYDGLVAQFGVEPVPTVGFGMGDVTLYNFLMLHELMPKLKSETDLYVVLIGDVYKQAIKSIKTLREEGVRVAVDTTGRKVDKQIKSAVNKGVRWALFIGEQELAANQFELKDLQTGKQETHGLERIITTIADYRKS